MMTSPIQVVSSSDVPWKKIRMVALVLGAAAVVVFNLAGEAGSLIFPASNTVITCTATGSNDGTKSNHSNDSHSREAKLFESHKIQAAVALRVMEAQDKMTTPFSSRQRVLQKGFPSNLQWKPCVLERIFQQKLKWKSKQGKPMEINIAVVGGSTAARPGNRCPLQVEDTSSQVPVQAKTSPDGRHGGQLHQKLHQEFDHHKSLLNATTLGRDESSMKFQVRTYAQGGINSVTSSLLMDSYINPNNTDIIIWDFLVNDDAASGGEEEQLRKLDFWLTRVHAHFTQGGRPPPPIVLLCLWGNGAKNKVLNNKGKPNNEIINILDRQPARYFGGLLGKYMNLGWNIAMVNVGAAINATALSQNVNLLLDDTNHPSCAGTSLIGDMIQHLFYNNVASKSCTLQRALAESPLTPTIPLPHRLREAKLPKTKAQWTPLWRDLFREDARIGSVSVWQPVEVNQTNLHLLPGWQASINTWPTKNTAKHTPGRSDIKNGLVLPKCANRTISKMLNFHLQEPDLKWIGLNMQGRKTHVYVNGEAIKDGGLAKDWCFGTTQVSHWINLRKYPNIKVSEEGIYTVSFCHGMASSVTKESQLAPTLSFLIGVTMQDDTQLTDQAKR